MATLKYKTSDGTYVTIPAMQGPVGPMGTGIANIKQTTVSNVSGGSNVWTITLTDGTTSTLTIKNGAQGATGPAGGILDVAESTTKGYITVTKADNSTKQVPVGDPNALLKSGGVVTGAITKVGDSTSWISGRDTAIIKTTSYSGYNAITSIKTTNGAWDMGVYTNDKMYFTYTPDTQYNAGENSGYTQIRIEPTGVLYGACWNDYAEYRETKYEVKPGRVVSENGDDTLSQTYKRLQPVCSIVSDTYGFAIGETEKCKTPLAMAGRVLAYPYENRDSYKPGDAVCSGPNGTVSKMTCQEKVMYPECIIGYVSCVPTYEVWGEKDTKVDGRIWIKVV